MVLYFLCLMIFIRLYDILTSFKTVHLRAWKLFSKFYKKELLKLLVGIIIQNISHTDLKIPPPLKRRVNVIIIYMLWVDVRNALFEGFLVI